MKIKPILCLLSLLSIALPTQAADTQSLTTRIAGECRHGLQHQPNGPFAIIVFCEDALGAFLAVSCFDAGVCRKDGTGRFEGWSLGSRVWQEKPWAADIDSIAWSPDGKSLFVATGAAYGSGALYLLDLERRTATQILPEGKPVSESEPGSGYSIDEIDDRNLTYHLQTDDLRRKLKRPISQKNMRN